MRHEPDAEGSCWQACRFRAHGAAVVQAVQVCRAAGRLRFHAVELQSRADGELSIPDSFDAIFPTIRDFRISSPITLISRDVHIDFLILSFEFLLLQDGACHSGD
ncbi:hypothetical protein [Burkholderia plantarii]|uniref:hypothetical protein n=1 Tax=Burkholderia plantarii TaxID=41899 RepID=UPI00114D1B31|nr:hypothetical protein [Burkholderia plantarii]